MKNTLPGYTGNEVRGISIETSRNIEFSNTSISNLFSVSGYSIGVDVMFSSENISG